MKEKIGELLGVPIVQGDKNIVTNNEIYVEFDQTTAYPYDLNKLQKREKEGFRDLIAGGGSIDVDKCAVVWIVGDLAIWQQYDPNEESGYCQAYLRKDTPIDVMIMPVDYYDTEAGITHYADASNLEEFSSKGIRLSNVIDIIEPQIDRNLITKIISTDNIQEINFKENTDEIYLIKGDIKQNKYSSTLIAHIDEYDPKAFTFGLSYNTGDYYNWNATHGNQPSDLPANLHLGHASKQILDNTYPVYNDNNQLVGVLKAEYYLYLFIPLDNQNKQISVNLVSKN